MYQIQTVEPQIEITGLVMGLDVIRPQGFYFRGESHDFWEAVLVCEGEVTATADERVYRMKAGNLVFHKPMEFHRIWSEGDSMPHLRIISFRADGSGMRWLENRLFRLDKTDQDKFIPIIDGIERARAMAGDTGERRYLLSLTAARLTVLLQELTGADEEESRTLSDSERQFAEIVGTMKRNCERWLCLKELAALCGMSVSNMKRVFALYSDVGVAKYFLSLKIRRAQTLLEEGMRGTQVAERLNFSETGYFYTVFRRETGVTPSQYRKNRQSTVYK